MTNNFQNESMEGWIKKDETGVFIEDNSGKKLFTKERIWDGYVAHWLNKKVLVRELPQNDPKTGLPIVLIWREDGIERNKNQNYIEVYYNERLVKYWASFFGHISINVGGSVFNFSNKISEDEILTPEEYFYRPVLGDLAPTEDKKDSAEKDVIKFGRRFMRSIHILRIEGDSLDIELLRKIFKKKMDSVHNAPTDSSRPGFYKDFSFYSNSCVTIIRDGLREGGFADASGFLSRDFFMSCAKSFRKMAKKNNLSVSLRLMPQLMISEAPPSKMTLLFNPLSYWRRRKYFDDLPVDIVA